MSEDSHQDPLLVQHLSTSDERCPLCRYALRGLTGTRCPECGAEFRLRVGLSQPNLAGWVIGLIGIAASLGFNGLMTVMFVILSFAEGPPPNTLQWFSVPVGGTISSSVMLVVWLRYASRLRRLKRDILMVWGIACWCLPVVSFIAFMVIIMD